ncbi:glycosaminoglycan xylosylkinase isoform X2 [Anabrus simplex]|uniref:glycosaminoglycan xylosylkinase isoform X2 n=1 Tax=Anabrus simplex TaxID=316456 RepID=UPI0035A327DA
MRLFDIMMVVRRQCAVVSLTALFLLVLSANVYFMYLIVEDKSPNVVSVNHVVWVTAREMVPERSPLLGSVLRTLCSTRIVRAENAQHGTQLKLMLTLLDKQKALFKPQWYPRSEVIEGPVYAGKDRHNAEVAAFHLSILLGLRRCPLTVGRKVNLRREVMPVASEDLFDTFYQEGNNTCFYGVCYYCSAQDPVCARKDVMEGALIMWLPPGPLFKLKKFRNPWQRTYRPELAARWETDDNYCNKLKATRLYNPATGPRLLDLVDAAIFDFLIDNGDRHHYEVFENITDAVVLLLDNGKSFGNPSQDHLDILAPLYQCCILRKSTWDKLLLFRGNALSVSLEALLQHSHISPVLSSAHLKALDRRLLAVFATFELCISRYGVEKVLMHDAVR